jgi:predicted alpha-1,6-mannanase (GH76 family)
MKVFHSPKLQGTIASLFASVLLLTPVAHAQDHGDEAYNAWTSAFLVTKDLGKNTGMTFFAKSLTGPDHNVPDDNWRLAFHIMVVEDTYLHTRKPEQLKLIDTLLSNYMQFYGTDFSGDDWNDDLGWISIAFVRGYQITGEQKYLDLSANVWNLAYNRGWDNQIGGGIWENRQARPGKEALSNNPFVISGVALYEATQDNAYLTKSAAIYAWVHKNLFDTGTGQVNQGMNPPNTLSPGDNVYNSGTFIIGANDLYRVLGTAGYYDDALKAINHVLGKGPILHDSDNTQNALWAYWFIKALAEFSNANNAWTQYMAYLDNNAQSSWANRNAQTNLTGNDWTKVYTYTDTTEVGPMPSDSGVAIWQLIEPSGDAGVGGSDGDAPGGGGGPGAGGIGGSGGSMASGGGTAAIGGAGSTSGGSAADGGSVVLPDGGVALSTSRSSGDSGCGCVVGAKRGPRGLALSGLVGLLLFGVSRRRQSVRSVRSRRAT